MARIGSHGRTRLMVALALLASTLAVGIAAQEVRAASVSLPTAQYQISVNAASTVATPTVYSGGGSWTNVELLNGELAAPLFRVASDQKVPARSSVIVSNLGGATAVRAALANVVPASPPSPEADACFGNSANEQAALTAYGWNGATWGTATGTLVNHEGQPGCYYLSVSTTGFTQIMFVVDLYCRTDAPAHNGAGAKPACTSVSGLTPGGTNLKIEIEGSGDGVFNSGYSTSDIGFSGRSKLDNVVTLTLSEGHGLQVGDIISRLNGEGDDTACFSRSFSITARTDTSVTLTAPCAASSGGGAVRKVGKGDEAFEIVFGTDRVTRYVPPPTNDFVNALTADRAAFIDRTGMAFDAWRGLLAVPTCTNASDIGPCLESAPTSSTTGYTSGWSVMLLDEYGNLRVRPWRDTYPFHVTSGVSVDLELRMPRGFFRGFANFAFDDGMSSAFSNAQINSFSYDAGPTFHTVRISVTAREMSRVARFNVDVNNGTGDEWFTDYCFGRLGVETVGGATVVFLDGDSDGLYDPGEENVSDCQNETEGFTVERVVLWGDASGNGDRAWLYAPGHTFGVGQTVTVCCAYGAFDGAQVVAQVGNPYGGTGASGGPNDWFAFNTSTSGTFNNVSFPRADGSPNPGWQVVEARAVQRNYIRVTSTSLTMDVILSQVGPECLAIDCGFFIPSNQHLAGGFISTNAQAFAFGPGMNSGTPSFDFGVAGPSRNASGTLRTTDGFFRVCIPPGFLASKFGGLPAATVAAQIDGRSASSAANRNGALIATAATCGQAGGVLSRLDQFGFSAPYFAIRPVAESGGGDDGGAQVPVDTAAPTTTAAPATTVAPPTTVTRPTASTLPARQIPGAGRVVPIETAPPVVVADGIGMKASRTGITLAIDPPDTAARRGQTIEVRIIGSDGTRRTIRLAPSSSGRNSVASFNGLGAGEYRIVVVVKNRNGRPAGRWSSPPVNVAGRRR